MLLQAASEFCEHYARGRTCWLALSGGVDSMTLLWVMSGLKNLFAIDLRVVHVNHGISPYAMQWAAHCQRAANETSTAYVEHNISLDLSAGASLEDIARQSRYAFFAELMGDDDLLLTAHHQDDQAETVLLQLLRGAGPKGLSSMPVMKPFAKGFHGRPFLQVPRSVIKQYAESEGIQWIHDESNDDLSLSRNFLRHEIMPRLTSRWPSASSTLARSAMHCAEQQKLLDEFALYRYDEVQGAHPGTISVRKLLHFNPETRRLLIRSWINRFHFPLPNTKKMQTILDTVLLAAWDKTPCVQWGSIILRRHRDDLYLLSDSPAFDASRTYTWNFSDTLSVCGWGKLFVRPVMGRGFSSVISEVTVRYRQGGEKIDIPLRGRRTLKNLFQEWQLPPWERDRVPLIYVGNELAAIAGYFLHEKFTARRNEQGKELVYEREGV